MEVSGKRIKTLESDEESSADESKDNNNTVKMEITDEEKAIFVTTDAIECSPGKEYRQEYRHDTKRCVKKCGNDQYRNITSKCKKNHFALTQKKKIFNSNKQIPNTI